MALWYGGLFALASAVTYFSVYCTLQGSITRQVDAELLSFAKELEYHYTHGEASEEGEGKGGSGGGHLA